MRYYNLLLGVFFLHSCIYAQSYWAKQIDDQTVRHGWRTYEQFFAPKVVHALTEKEFEYRVKKARKKFITCEQFVTMGVGNERLERYWQKKTPQEIYPVWDRPRGDKDVESIKMLMKTKTPVSPVLIGKICYKDGFEQWVLLDGMHRIIAAHLLRVKLKVCLVNLC